MQSALRKKAGWLFCHKFNFVLILLCMILLCIHQGKYSHKTSNSNSLCLTKLIVYLILWYLKKDYWCSDFHIANFEKKWRKIANDCCCFFYKIGFQNWTRILDDCRNNVPIMYSVFTDMKHQSERHGVPVTGPLVVSGNLDSNWVASQSLRAAWDLPGIWTHQATPHEVSVTSQLGIRQWDSMLWCSVPSDLQLSIYK